MVSIYKFFRPADSIPNNWVDRYVPSSLLPFFRLARVDRPIGTWLLIFPYTWACVLSGVVSANNYIALKEVLFGIIGAFFIRGAGCTYNDIIDKDIDLKVERTKYRPLPAGHVSLAGAILFLIFQLLAGFLVLLFFNYQSALVISASLLFIGFYPFAKRLVAWPQLVLGFTYSWGVFAGWVAQGASWDFVPLFLYLSCVFWVVGYDTIYAFQDSIDDSVLGIKSTALAFAGSARLGVGTFYFASVVCFLLALFSIRGVYWHMMAGVPFALHLIYQIVFLDPSSSSVCLRLFKSNKWAGLWGLGGCLVLYVFFILF